LTPTIGELAKKYNGQFVVGKVNVDEEPDLAQKYRACVGSRGNDFSLSFRRTAVDELK
jgi:thiol-disulfide isomerase/thioredoxin